MSTVIPGVCRKCRYCLIPDHHDGRCQPGSRREQRKVAAILARMAKA